MLSNFQLFKKQLDESLDLVDAALGEGGGEPFEVPENIDFFPDTQSLLARCERACKKHEKGKPTIRIIHQLACSGGTLISKCISALPNVFLLSEVHPFSTLQLGAGELLFAPSDLTLLSIYANFPHIDEFAKQQFLSAIKLSDAHIRKFGGVLVLRDHSHSDFCIGESKGNECAVISVLKGDFEILSATILRDPIDCYLSLTNNNWKHFSPQSFNEYCQRVLDFLAAYKNTKVFLYEDFVARPKFFLKQLCNEIDLPFSEESIDIFDVFKVTGDSGRSGTTICQRERRNLNENLKSEIRQSKNYPLIAERFGYQPI